MSGAIKGSITVVNTNSITNSNSNSITNSNSNSITDSVANSTANSITHAVNSGVRFLSRRDHSELELRRKLQKKGHGLAEISGALERLRELGLLRSPELLAREIIATFDRQLKGIHRINKKLRERGLPMAREDEGGELEKAQKLLAKIGPPPQPQLSPLKYRAKLARQLRSRGFSESCIGKILRDNTDNFEENL